MLSAEKAVDKWTESLVKELQALPQQAPGKALSKKQQATQERTWGLQISQKLGTQNRPTTVTSPARASAAPTSPRSAKVAQLNGMGISITQQADLAALAAAAKFEKEMSASEPSCGEWQLAQAPGKATENAIASSFVSQQGALQAVSQPSAAEGVEFGPSSAKEFFHANGQPSNEATGKNNGAKSPAAAMGLDRPKAVGTVNGIPMADFLQKKAAESANGALPKGKGNPEPGFSGSTVSNDSNSAAWSSPMDLTTVRKMALASTAAAGGLSDLKMKIPKEWLSKMQKQ